MLNMLKKRLYFFVARYFRFWARLKLKRWHPQVIAITGSAGKTTLLHLVEAQLGDKAHYSHHANSSFGVPFDILGLPANINSRLQWFVLLMRAPLKVFSRPYSQKVYVVEVDADRPHEAQFLAELLHPSVTLWISALHSHTSQFDKLAQQGKFKNVREAVAYEYGNVAAHTTDVVILDGDNELITDQESRMDAEIRRINFSKLKEYKLGRDSTQFSFGNTVYNVPAILPKNNFYQVAMVDALLTYLKQLPDYEYKHFVMPPGRSNTFPGIRGTTLFDSTYNNSNIDSLRSVLQVFNDYPAVHKWAVIGDMLEQGEEEDVEHRKIVEELVNLAVDRIILIGPRTAKYTAPELKTRLKNTTQLAVFTEPSEVLDYLQANLQGGETILFKGVRYLEGVIEPLLADSRNAEQLVRRGPQWDKKRASWGMS